MKYNNERTGRNWRNLRQLCFAVIVLSGSSASFAERHEGYYFPTLTSSETYKARATTFADSNRTRRIFFVTELTNQMMENPYPPPFAIFAKGTAGQKMVITSLYENGYNTLFRMRGLLALLTARSRSTPAFQDYEVQDVYTFLDLLKLLGFEQLTVTDGDKFAHRIYLK